MDTVTRPSVAQGKSLPKTLTWHPRNIGHWLSESVAAIRESEQRRHTSKAVQNTQRHEDPQERTRCLELVARVGQKTIDILELGVLLREVVKLISDISGYYNSQIALVEGSYVVLKTATLAALRPLEGQLRNRVGSGSIIGWVAGSGDPLLVSDVSVESHYAFVEEAKETKSELAIPIKLRGRVIGVLDVWSTKLNAFSKIDILALQIIADQLAIAIENSRLYDAEQYQYAPSQMLQSTAKTSEVSANPGDASDWIVSQLSAIVNYDRAMLMLVEQDKLSVVAASGFSNQSQILETTYHYPDIPLLHEAMAAGEPLILPDAQKDPRWIPLSDLSVPTRGWIGVPFIASDIVIGFLSISSNRPDAYSARDAQMVSAFAKLSALAIENNHIIVELERSLSDLQEAHIRLERTARLSAAGEIAAGVAHQINNPLMTIVGDSRLLLDELASENPGYESAEAINRAAYQAGKVVRRLLDFSRSASFSKKPVDVNLSLQRSISIIRAQIEPNITRLVVELAQGLPQIEASEQHLEDVWINLLLNAKDAVGKKQDGLIRVSTALNAEANAIEVTVQDNGRGIPSQNLQLVFTPFFTTKEHGYGLGLSICHDIILRHDGSIRVDSEEGQGTTFTIMFPLSSN